MTRRPHSNWARSALRALAPLWGLLMLLAWEQPASAHSPMCDESGASIVAPPFVLPAPSVQDGEIRQGQPCKKAQTMRNTEAGTPQRPLGMPLDHDAEQEGLLVPALASPVSMAVLVARDLERGVAPTAIPGSRVYRPPRTS